MTLLQLRNHIPICGPSNREPVDGTETDMRVSLGFEPAWYHKRCSIDFLQSWHDNPCERFIGLKRAKVELTKCFPDIPYWDMSSEEDLATISGCYGVCVIPQLFGLSVRYRQDRWPTLESGQKLSVDAIENLQVEDLLSGPFMENLTIQMDTIASEWGVIHGYPNMQGVLNNAFHIRGQDIFIDMLERPAFVHFFFDLITDTMIQFAQILQKKQRTSGFNVDQCSVSNCVVNMISPGMYREFVFPYDKRIAMSFKRFGVHTCEWDVTPYIDEFYELPKLGYLDMGMQSDMKCVRDRFPDTRRTVLYNPAKLEEATIKTIAQDMKKIYADLAPCDIVLADVQATTPDSRIHDVLTICKDLESG